MSSPPPLCCPRVASGGWLLAAALACGAPQVPAVAAGDGEVEAPSGGPAASPAPSPSAPADPGASGWCGAEPCPCTPGTERTQGSRLWVCDLAEPRTLGGHACGAGRVSFYDDGRLRDCELSQVTEFDGLRCAASPASTRFHLDGRLRECVLARTAKIDGITMEEGVRVGLHESGRLRRGEVEEPVELDGYACRGVLRLGHDGHLLQCTLASPASVEGVDLPSRTRIVLYGDGGLRQLTVRAPFEVEGRRYERDEQICFGAEGEVVDGPCDIAW